MAWTVVLFVALCAISSGEANNKSQPTGKGRNKTDTSQDKWSDATNDAPNTKLDDPPYRPTSKNARYYVGRYAGLCHGKGMYYKDKFSFVICQHRIRHTQRCPAGTINEDITHFHPKTLYNITPFCSINLNDYGYTVSKRKAFALQKGARPVSRPPPPRAAQGRKAHKGDAPRLELKGSAGYQRRRPIIGSQDPVGYGGPSIVKGSPIDSHHRAFKGISREARAAEWSHKGTYSKYPKHTKKDLSFVRPVESSLVEASSERKGPNWSSEDSPEYRSTEHDTYPADTSRDVHGPRYNSRQSNNKPSRFTQKRPIYPGTKREYSDSHELSAEHPHIREASYSNSYHRDHSYEPRNPYLPPANGARSPRKQLIKGSNRPMHRGGDSSVEYPIHHRPQKSNSVRRPVDNSYKGDYYGKGPSRGLSVKKYKFGSPHIPRDNYKSSPYKESREWSTDRLYSHESHSDDMYPVRSYERDSYRSGAPMKEQYGKDYSSERRFSSMRNKYETPQFKGSTFLGEAPELNSFENSIFGDAGFRKDNNFRTPLRKDSYSIKSPIWDDTYSAPNYDRQLSSTKHFPYSGMASTRYGAKTGRHLPRTSPLFEIEFESQKTNGHTDTFDDKRMRGSGEYAPKKPDELETWLTDLSHIEYPDSDPLFQNSNPANSQQSLFSKGPQSKELGVDTSFGDKNSNDARGNEFSKSSAKNSPPKKSGAEWNNWLKDLSDIEHKYADKDQQFQRRSSSEIRTVDFGPQHPQMSSDVNPSLQGSSDRLVHRYGDSGKSIPALGNNAGSEAGFGTVNGSGINRGQDSDKDWSKWLTDLTDIAPQYEGSVTDAPSVEFSENNIKYNPFIKTEKNEADWDKWMKDSSDIGPMVERNQNRNQDTRLMGAKNGAQPDSISGFGQSSQPAGKFAGMPQLPFNQPDLSSIGNVKINPEFGNDYNMHHIRPQDNNTVKNVLGNQHHHENTRSIGNTKFNPHLRNDAINRQQTKFNNNRRPGPPLVHIRHPNPNTNIPIRISPLEVNTHQQNTQNHGHLNIPPSNPTDHSKIQYRRTRAMRSKEDSGRPNTFGKTIQISNNKRAPANVNFDGTIIAPPKQDTGSSRAGEVYEVHASSRPSVIMNRMFNWNRYGNGRETASVRRQVRPLVGVKLHQLVTTPVYDDKSSGVTGHRIVLSAV